MQIFQIDLSTKHMVQTVYAKQGDVGRKFQVVLTDGTVAYPIPAGVQFSVWYSGPGGEGNYSAIGDKSAFEVRENTVTVELIAQMLMHEGTGVLCVVMNAADGTQLGLWNMVYAVEPVPGTDSQGAQQFYTALSEVAAQAIRAAETFQTDPALKIPGRAADAEATGVALAGKAPAGFGLGTHATAVSDFNEATVTGWYSGTTGTANKPFGYSLVHVINRNGTEVLQIGYDMASTTSGSYAAWTSRIRRRSNNAWSEWEYVNPPMYLGVGYRTVERWQGKAVYTKQINLGALPSTGTGTYENIASAIDVLDFKLNYKGKNNNSYCGNNLVTEIGQSGGGNVFVKVAVSKDLSSCTGYLTLKYTLEV